MMNKYTALFACLLFYDIIAAKQQTQITNNTMDDEKSIALALVVTGHVSDNKNIKVCYEIRNNSDQDVWICESISHAYDFEVFLDKDGQTLVIRKRMDVPTSFRWRAPPIGKYVRLESRKKLTESLLVDVPVNPPMYTYYSSSIQLQGVAYVKRLSIEIGYYDGNLPQMYLDMLQGHENPTDDRSKIQNMHLGSVVGFNRMNEPLRRRDDEVRIQYTYQKFKGEKVLVTTISNLNIPYEETRAELQYTPPDITTCNRLEIQYEPSLIEYFYPYESEQRLLNKEEVDYLRSQKKAVIEDAKDISYFANELKQAKMTVGGMVSEKSKANVIAYHDSRRVVSFIVYDDTTVETEKKQRIKYYNGLQSLRTLTHKIRAFELRMNCAANMKRLWYRLRFYDQTEKSRIQSLNQFKIDDPNIVVTPIRAKDRELDFEEMSEGIVREIESRKKNEKELYSIINFIYPSPRNWCDAMEALYGWHTSEAYFSYMKAHVCPGVSEGRSTYAMNPNCKYDSPPDMVLLFETKSGWNQHGGPELFTFDNHDPKGGCVLLNDGTVKFIRTKEELQQLCWK